VKKYNVLTQSTRRSQRISWVFLSAAFCGPLR
jgi:hypothetical protein